MDDVLSKLEKSNKTIFLMGDFNINLLSYEHHTETNDFINSMVSHSSTVIDNIFSSVTEYETISGNIINQIADYFAQFLPLKRININNENINFYQYNYFNFSKENFVEH